MKKRSKVVETVCGLFVGKRRGDCIKVSVPANTENEWTRAGTEFLDLPLMDKETFASFRMAIRELGVLFEEEED